MDKEYTKIVGLLVLYNCIIASLFTVLAIVFGKWWIIFLSIIFWKPFKVSLNTDKETDKNGSEF